MQEVSVSSAWGIIVWIPMWFHFENVTEAHNLIVKQTLVMDVFWQ